jgi:hexulose-6-phosphate isomerase
MSPEPPEFLHPRPGGFSRRDLIRTGALAGTAAAALVPFHAGAQEAAGTTASKPDERRSSPKAYPKLKKSINLWAFPYPSRMTLRECLQLAKDAGFDGVELNYDLESDLSPKAGPAEFTAIRKMADEIGIAISGLCSFLFWPIRSPAMILRNGRADSNSPDSSPAPRADSASRTSSSSPER